LLRGAGEATGHSPLLFGRPIEEPDTDKVLLIVVTSDRGLAGAFNSGLIRFAEARIRDTYAAHKASNRLALITAGRRGTDYFSKRGYNVVDKHVGIFTKLQFESAKAIATLATELFTKGE